jgi:hypothetical protein
MQRDGEWKEKRGQKEDNIIIVTRFPYPLPIIPQPIYTNSSPMPVTLVSGFWGKIIPPPHAVLVARSDLALHQIFVVWRERNK